MNFNFSQGLEKLRSLQIQPCPKGTIYSMSSNDITCCNS